MKRLLVLLALIALHVAAPARGDIFVSSTGGLTTSESGLLATFNMVLTTMPTASVTIGLSSSDATEGAVSPPSIAFTAANWSTPQTVTVTGQNDLLDDDNVAYAVVTGPATSTDPAYSGLNAPDVWLINRDDDIAEIVVSPTLGLLTSEAGITTTFTVALATQPVANVSIGLSSADLTEGTVTPPSLTFTPANWSVAQTVTVTGQNDALADGNIGFGIVTAAATSSDPSYGGRNAADVGVVNNDDEAPGQIVVTPTAGLVVTEAGGLATFTMVLSTMPTANVTIGLASSDLTEGVVSPPSVTFTNANWSTPQTVTVVGQNDLNDDGNIAFAVVTAAATSTDPGYGGREAPDVSVSSLDNDVASFQVTPTSGLVTSEAGGTATFTVALATQPLANVTVGLSSTDASEGTVSAPSITFTAANWSVPQTVTVTGQNDVLDDGDVCYTIVTAPSSADPEYNARDAADVGLTNNDDDLTTAAPGDDEAVSFALEDVRPNPVRANALTVVFALSAEGSARLELFDVHGRRMVDREVGSLGVGRHTVELAHGARLAPGMYWVHLVQGADRRSTRVTVLK